jgi:hypothetical protein
VADIGSLNANTQGALSATKKATNRNFGVDLSCTTGIRSGVLVSGVLLVAESAYRRLTTPRGMLYGGEDEQNFGLDIVGILGTAGTPDEAASIPAQIEAELLKDARISAVTANITSTKSGPAVTWGINVQATTDDGPFTLVLAVSDVTVQLLGISTGVTT